MRYIPLTRVTGCETRSWRTNSPNWRARVSRAVNKATCISAIGNKWSDLKPEFVSEFGDKCWYTETPRIGTDNHVDHFRPKGRAKKKDGKVASRTVAGAEEKHAGYWWLAFEISNYRYSCIYANRITGEGGKGDFFPLEDEGSRAWTRADALSDENVTLLDPCSLDDVQLVEFDHVPGGAVARYDAAIDPVAFERFEVSRKHYNLNEASIVKARQGVIGSVRKDLVLLENCASLPAPTRATLAAPIDAAETAIVEACERDAPFSAAVVSLIKTKKAESWMAGVLTRADLSP